MADKHPEPKRKPAVGDVILVSETQSDVFTTFHAIITEITETGELVYSVLPSNGRVYWYDPKGKKDFTWRYPEDK